MKTFLLRPASLLLSLPLLGTLPGCITTNEAEVREWLQISPELRATNPADIAVLPVEDATPEGTVGALAGHIREEINRALVQRSYSHLSSTYVDAHMGRRNVVPAAGGESIVEPAVLSRLASKADEDAILAVQIARWDQTTLLVDNQVKFLAKVTLFGSKDRKVLWSGGLSGSVEAGGLRAAPRDPEARAKAAASEFVDALIGRLPMRRL